MLALHTALVVFVAITGSESVAGNSRVTSGYHDLSTTDGRADQSEGRREAGALRSYLDHEGKFLNY